MCRVQTLFIITLYFVVIFVSGKQIAYYERRWLGKRLPQGRIIAMRGEIGIQATTRLPGIHILFPFLFVVTKTDLTEIQPGEVGIVESIDGLPIPAGRIFAQQVEGHSLFQDGEHFLKNGRQKGPQIDILLSGTYRINADLFHVEILEATTVPPKQVGLVAALDGAPLSSGEFIASSVAGHDDFQNAQAFLHSNGQRGPQLDILRPGIYYNNPLMFRITLDDIEVVQRGEVAVHISNVGKAPTEDMLADSIVLDTSTAGISDRERYVVPAGFRGIQKDVIGPGRYYLNTWAYKYHIFNTTNQTFEWDDSKESQFESLKVISKDGFQIEITVKVVIRIHPEQCPYMMAKVGSMENLATNVLHPMIEPLFRTRASSISAMNFLLNREEEQARADKQTRMDLLADHVECVSVLICQVVLPQELMQTLTRRIIAEQLQHMFLMQKEAEAARVATKKTRATANQQKMLVKAEIDSRAAYEVKSSTITIAEAEARKIEMLGNAIAEAYRVQSDALGQKAVSILEVIKRLSDGKIKITPDILVSKDNGTLLEVLLAQLSRGKSGVSAIFPQRQNKPIGADRDLNSPRERAQINDNRKRQTASLADTPRTQNIDKAAPVKKQRVQNAAPAKPNQAGKHTTAP